MPGGNKNPSLVLKIRDCKNVFFSFTDCSSNITTYEPRDNTRENGTANISLQAEQLGSQLQHKAHGSYLQISLQLLEAFCSAVLLRAKQSCQLLVSYGASLIMYQVQPALYAPPATEK